MLESKEELTRERIDALRVELKPKELGFADHPSCFLSGGKRSYGVPFLPESKQRRKHIGINLDFVFRECFFVGSIIGHADVRSQLQAESR